MKNTLVRTAIISSLLTAMAVSAVAYFAMPRISAVQASSDQGVTLSPQTSQPAQNATPAPRLIPRPSPMHRATYAGDANPYPETASNPEPVQGTWSEPVRRTRSTEKSVAIVAGSAGAGAAIGALAGGGKGAGIGAISGGVAGFIFDRLTAHK